MKRGKTHWGGGTQGTGDKRQRRSCGVKEVSWSVPDGFEVADEPSKLDTVKAWLAAARTCTGRSMIGSLTELGTLSLAPRLVCTVQKVQLLFCMV